MSPAVPLGPLPHRLNDGKKITSLRREGVLGVRGNCGEGGLLQDTLGLQKSEPGREGARIHAAYLVLHVTEAKRPLREGTNEERGPLVPQDGNRRLDAGGQKIRAFP